MSSHGRRLDHWTHVARRRRGAARAHGGGRRTPHEDAVTRQLMAQVAHAKSSSFIALLDARRPRARRQPGRADRRRRRPLRGRSACRCGRPPWWSAAAPRTCAIGRARRSPRPPRAASPASTSTCAIEGAGARPGTLDLAAAPAARRATGGSRSSSPRAGTITDRKRVEQRLARQNAELSALTAAPRARPRLPRAAARRALARPARAAAGRHHALRAGAAVGARRRTSARSSSTSGSPRSARSSRSTTCSSRSRPTTARRGSRSSTPTSRSAVRTVAESVRAAGRRPRASSSTVDAPDALAARFDVERVSRIVSNLLANAIRHAPVGGSVRCALARGRRRRGARTSPTPGPACRPSTATGSSAASAPGLDGDGRSGGAGAGLGLAIVREFVELHGGEISLGDAPEGGALFTVTLPLRPPDGERVAGDARPARRGRAADGVRALAARGRADRRRRPRRRCRRS